MIDLLSNVLYLLEPIYYPGTLLRVLITHAICRIAGLRIDDVRWLRLGFPMSYVRYQPPLHSLRGLGMIMLIIAMTGLAGLVLVAPAVLRLNMEQAPSPLEWLGLGLGVSALGSLFPEEPGLLIPAYPSVRLVLSAALTFLPIALIPQKGDYPLFHG